MPQFLIATPSSSRRHRIGGAALPGQSLVALSARTARHFRARSMRMTSEF
jgi:hypothetical protein